MTSRMHAFEQAGLGKAPFRLHDYRDRPGSACDYCGTLIKHVFVIRSVDGRTSNVGSTCVMKTADYSLRQAVEEKIAELKAQSAQQRIGRMQALLGRRDVLETLAKEQAPDPWRARAGDTAKDWCLWMVQHSEQTGKLKVAKFLEQFEFGGE